MRFRLLLPLLLLTALVLPAAPASADYRVGIGEQDPAMFDHEAFQALNVKRVRLIVPWDWYRHDYQIAETGHFMQRAKADGAEVLVAFTAPRGCYEDGEYTRSWACNPPSAKKYEYSLERFQEEFGRIRAFSPWNEANHVSQPTHERPQLAVRYYRVAREACDGCRIVAADVLDSSDVGSWLREFIRHAPGKPRIWGLHNYADVNRERSRGLRTVLRMVPGQLWLTETGGIVSFGRQWPYSISRATNRTRHMYELANRFTRPHRSRKSRVTRMYIYQWNGREKGTLFDSGLTDHQGDVRRQYKVVLNRMDSGPVIAEDKD